MLYPKPQRKPKKREQRKDQNKLYGELVKPAYLRGLAAGQRRGVALCEVCVKNPATEIHHKRGREGADLLDPSGFMGVCSKCHREIHSEPQWAYLKGYLSSRLVEGRTDRGQELAEVAEDGAGAAEHDGSDEV